MPMLDFIDARVCVNGESLREYVLPDGDQDGQRSRTRYIEVSVGQRFSVVVKLAPNFELKHARWFYSSFVIDDDSSTYYEKCSHEDLKHHKGYLREAHVVEDRKTQSIYDDAVGRWVSAAFEFGPLGITDDVYDPQHHSPEQVSHIGQIQVTFFRAIREKRDKSFTWQGKMPNAVDKLPEQVLKGHEIKANTKYIPIGPAMPAKPEHFDYVPVKGSAGKPYEFTFRYRTRKALQNLGCIPRSPSPEPDLRLVHERDQDTIRNLKERLNQYESGTIKSEHSRRSTTVKAKPNTHRVPVKSEPNARKRTHDDFEVDNDDDNIQEIACPAKASRVQEMIDLTGDSD